MNRSETDQVQARPEFDAESASLLAWNAFQLRGTFSSLPSERDLNFKIETEQSGSYVLKISNPAVPRDLIELENQAIQLVAAADRFSELQLFRNHERQLITETRDLAGRVCLARLIRFVEGQKPRSTEGQISTNSVNSQRHHHHHQRESSFLATASSFLVGVSVCP